MLAKAKFGLEVVFHLPDPKPSVGVGHGGGSHRQWMPSPLRQSR